MWREPRVDDRYYRDDITSVFIGRTWFYAFIESRMEVHRLAWFDDTYDIALVRRKPYDGLALNKVFQNKSNSVRHHDWRPKYRPPCFEGRWFGAKDPDSLPIALVNPWTLSVQSLTVLYNKLHPDDPIGPPGFTQLHVAQRRTIPSLEASDWVLVTHVPLGVSSMTISQYAHLIPVHSLPADTRSHQREEVLDVTATIRVLAQDCPHKEGSGLAREWGRLVDGQRVAQFLAETSMTRRAARDYIIRAARRGWISLQ